MTPSKSIVFLVDVDDTLLENDPIQDDLKRHIEREFGPECRDRFWTIQEGLFNELGYRDYLGALQRFRVEHPYERHLVTAANFLVDYPFANRLYSIALDVLEKLSEGKGSDSHRRRRCFSTTQGSTLGHLRSS
jgi:hypothetical protein